MRSSAHSPLGLLRLTRCVLLAVPLTACAGRFVHLDTAASPNYGSAELRAGDPPRDFAVLAGGEIDASALPSVDGGECAARNIDDHPDVRVTLRSPGPLRVSVESDGADTTLAVHGADGFHCDDDSGAGGEPEVLLPTAAPGRYEIWVGSYTPGHYPHVRLIVSTGPAPSGP